MFLIFISTSLSSFHKENTQILKSYIYFFLSCSETYREKSFFHSLTYRQPLEVFKCPCYSHNIKDAFILFPGITILTYDVKNKSLQPNKILRMHQVDVLYATRIFSHAQFIFIATQNIEKRWRKIMLIQIQCQRRCCNY